jgi:hypothetical protein
LAAMVRLFLLQWADVEQERWMSLTDGRPLTLCQEVGWWPGMRVRDVLPLLQLEDGMRVELVENSTEMTPLPADKLVCTMVSTNPVLLETWARHDCPLDAVYIVVRLTR